MNKNKYNNNKGYQNYGPVNQGQAQAQPAQDQWDGAPPQQQGYAGGADYAVDAQGNPILAGDMSHPAVAAFVKRVYIWFSVALATATGAAFGGVQLTEPLINAAITGDTVAAGTLSSITWGAWGVTVIAFIAMAVIRNNKGALKTGVFFTLAAACGLQIAPTLAFAGVAGLGMTVVYAFGLTTVLFGGLSVYVLSTNADFSKLGKVLLPAMTILFFLFIAMAFIPFPSVATTLIVAVALVVFLGFVLYDTSKITREYYHRDDALLAAAMLFYDFFAIFRFILYLLMGSSRD